MVLTGLQLSNKLSLGSLHTPYFIFRNRAAVGSDLGKTDKHILDRLPFTFPKKRVVRSNRSDVLVECVGCGYESYGSEYTYVKLCAGCGKSTKVINPEAEKRGEDRNFAPGMFATATDILRMREEREKKKGQYTCENWENLL